MDRDINQDKCWVKNSCKQEDCDKFCIKFYRINKLYNNALLSDKQKNQIILHPDDNGTDVEVFEELKYIKENIIDFVKGGNNLYIYSPITGNGKTSWSLKLLREYINKIWYKTNKDCVGMFINVPRYLLALKENISNKSDYVAHIKDNVYDCDLVIWDDIATKSATSFEHENLLSILDYRNNNNKSNIFTSNLSGEELNLSMGDRIYSRIYTGSIVKVLQGRDKRDIV